MKLKPLDQAIEDLKAYYESIENGGDHCSIEFDDERGYYCLICGISFVNGSHKKKDSNAGPSQHTNT